MRAFLVSRSDLPATLNASHEFTVQVAGPEHVRFAAQICTLIEEAARARGTGIAKRNPDYIRSKIDEGKAIIALQGDVLAGFCYIETWGHGRYVANSGLIVAPEFRKGGLATRIKQAAFELSRQKYPAAKIFGITTSLAVMKINTELGYRPVTFSELTDDEEFWSGCQSCPNYDVLTRTQRKMCLCTGMLFDPAWEQTGPDEAADATLQPLPVLNTPVRRSRTQSVRRKKGRTLQVLGFRKPDDV